MSAAEDYRAMREHRRREFGSVGAATSRGMQRPVIVTKCIECGKVIPYEGGKPNVCEECWNRINGYEQSGRWKLH